MRSKVWMAAVLLLLAPYIPPALGAPLPLPAESRPAPAPDRQRRPDLPRLIVFEASGCAYCRLLHTRILDDYRRSALARDLPVEIVDMDSLGTHGHALGAPIRTLPTLVVMKKGREIARITGLPARAFFLRFVSAVLTGRAGVAENAAGDLGR